ncbi:MAG: tetratricopeptide repeat protein [Candidatus Obscuribacterales bacterium]
MKDSRPLLLTLSAVLLFSGTAAYSSSFDPDLSSETEQKPNWRKDQDSGERALYLRQFEKADDFLERALHQAKNSPTRPRYLALSRLALGESYLKQGRIQEAYETLDLCRGGIRSGFGSRSTEYARCQLAIATCLVEFGKDEKAIDYARKAIDIIGGMDKKDSQLYGYALETLGMANARHGWHDDAAPQLDEALEIFKRYPGYKSLDLAAVLKEQAVYFYKHGDREKSARLSEESALIREKAMVTTQPASIASQVEFRWEPGSTRAREIIDSEFPFRYLTAGGVRVAATVVDLWELLAVLITITNVSDHQSEYELGKATLRVVDLDHPAGKPTILPPVDPNSIDRIRKERNMWDLTQNRPWLANIQKTRGVRGLVPHEGHDLFRGPNVFGVYGQWKAVSHTVPERLSIHPSREGLIGTTEDDTALTGMLRANHSSFKDCFNVTLEPFESRTGEIFYLNPRDQDVIISIPVGNTIFELPFHTRKQKIP